MFPIEFIVSPSTNRCKGIRFGKFQFQMFAIFQSTFLYANSTNCRWFLAHGVYWLLKRTSSDAFRCTSTNSIPITDCTLHSIQSGIDFRLGMPINCNCRRCQRRESMKIFDIGNRVLRQNSRGYEWQRYRAAALRWQSHKWGALLRIYEKRLEINPILSLLCIILIKIVSWYRICRRHCRCHPQPGNCNLIVFRPPHECVLFPHVC